MQFVNYSREKIPLIGKLATILGSGQEQLYPLIDLPISPDNFGEQINRKTGFHSDKRKVLVESLQHQYSQADLECPKKVKLLLDENCFTVCTGHQLNLLTGPLYSIYKIVHTIKLAEQLAAIYKNHSFLPVFWMASEDHDKDEIDHFYTSEQKVVWETTQTGAVGRMTTENWSLWQEQLITLFPYHKSKLNELFSVYKGETVSIAARRLIHFLFKETDLIILDGDDCALKKLFAPTIMKEVFSQSSRAEVQKANDMLSAMGYKSQAFARDINMFYLSENKRSRIENIENGFRADSITFSRNEMEDEINKHPERFSPNVILRPLYQETILPNLCYVGGAAELAYWLQLRYVFEAHNMPFPLLQLRLSLQILNQKQEKKMTSLGFDIQNFAQDVKRVEELFLQSKVEISDSDELDKVLLHLKNQFLSKAENLDFNLIASANAHVKEIEKIIESFDTKVRRHEKKKYTDSIDRIKELHNSIFPNNALQERHNNFIEYYLSTNGFFISTLLQNIDVFKHEFLVLKE